MDEEKRESKIDINELLNKYISDRAETSEGADEDDEADEVEELTEKPRHRRRMAARRTPESAQSTARECVAAAVDDGEAENEDNHRETVIYTDPSTDETVKETESAPDAQNEVEPAVEQVSSVYTIAPDYVHEPGADDDADEVEEAPVTEPDTADEAAPEKDVFEQYKDSDDGVSYDDIDDVNSDVKNVTYDDEGEAPDDQGIAAILSGADGELDDFDMNILLGLGLDEELEHTVGSERVSKFVNKQQSDLQKNEALSRERAALSYEFTNKTQKGEVDAMYAKASRTSKLKLAAAAVLTVVLLLLEGHATFGITLTGAFDPVTYPVVYIMVGLQIVLLAAAPAWRSILNGLRDFFRGKPTPECVAGFALVFNLVYNIALSIIGSFGEAEPLTFNLPVAVTFVLLYAYECINIHREMRSFRIVSSNKKKFALASLSMAESHLEHEAFSDLMEEDDKAEDISVLKIEGADFVGDYFLRTNRYAGGRKFIGFIIPLVIVFAAAFFAYKFNGGTVYDGAQAAMAVALLCLPVSVFYMFSHPFYRAVVRASDDDCTIVGEGSVEEYADAAIISFDDKSVFPSTGVNVRGINVFGNHRIDRVLYTAASVFCTVGGPLEDVFDLATREIGHSDDVTVERCLPGLLEVTADGESVIFGSIDAIESVGVRIPKPLLDHRNDDFGDTISVMYMVENGKFVARMLIQYLVDADFEFTLKQLDRSGMFVGVKTFDPNVTETFIGKQIKLKDYPVRIIRCKSLDDRTQTTDTTVSGLVSTDSPKSLLQTVTLCERVLHSRSINTMLAVISLFVSLLVAVLAVIFSAIPVSPIFVAIYELFWIVPMFITSRIIVS